MADASHAHWVAAWWSWALAQLTAQAGSGNETALFQALLAQFLNMNRMAVEGTGRIARVYDEGLWTDLHERCKRREPGCVSENELKVIDENRRTRARSSVALASARAKGDGKGEARVEQPAGLTTTRLATGGHQAEGQRSWGARRRW